MARKTRKYILVVSQAPQTAPDPAARGKWAASIQVHHLTSRGWFNAPRESINIGPNECASAGHAPPAESDAFSTPFSGQAFIQFAKEPEAREFFRKVAHALVPDDGKCFFGGTVTVDWLLNRRHYKPDGTVIDSHDFQKMTARDAGAAGRPASASAPS